MKVDSIENSSYVLNVGDIVMKENSEKRDQKGCQQLSEDRLNLIRQRIREKFYDQDEVLDQVAARMMTSPELQGFLKRLRNKG